MGIKQKESPNRSRFVLIALLVTATVLFAVWALAFHHHNLCVFLVSNYQSTLALLPTLTLLGMLAIVVNIDGMGSHTKWYFWPNAFLREFVGLLAESRIQQIIAVAVITLISAALTLAL